MAAARGRSPQVTAALCGSVARIMDTLRALRGAKPRKAASKNGKGGCQEVVGHTKTSRRDRPLEVH